ncbi:dTDP-4-dehydrorhamnose 3,5-epimerase family protein [Streptomyces sp. NPDC005955]|jgi:epimerase EvaD|uniref:dTDP-4-dehydrorhamnose 3,5-epimerase family protein n=1 Tax=Streptomyces sp. NPDC005955 TaxID=3364738 RepID=UPI00367795ED
MQVNELDIEGCFEFTPEVYRDHRGLFSSPYQDNPFVEGVGKSIFPVRDISYNISDRGVLRGIHFTKVPPGRAKYVYCPTGRVNDYLVDLRIGSPTFGEWRVAELSGENPKSLMIPDGVGHAFLALEPNSMLVYVMAGGYVPEHEYAISPFDPEVGLEIPEGYDIAQSERDRAAPTLAQARELGMLPDYEACKQVEAELWR